MKKSGRTAEEKSGGRQEQPVCRRFMCAVCNGLPCDRPLSAKIAAAEGNGPRGGVSHADGRLPRRTYRRRHKSPRTGAPGRPALRDDTPHERGEMASGASAGPVAEALAISSREFADKGSNGAGKGRCGQSGPQAAFRRPTARRAALRPEIGPYGY